MQSLKKTGSMACKYTSIFQIFIFQFGNGLGQTQLLNQLVFKNQQKSEQWKFILTFAEPCTELTGLFTVALQMIQINE